MFTGILISILSSTWSAPLAQVQPEQPAQQEENRREDRRQRGDRRGINRGGRGDRGFGRGGPPDFRNMSPEERRRMRDERMLEMTARTYDLSEDQKSLVRSEMQKMRDERKMLMGADYERYEQLREQMFNFWQNREGGDRGGRGGPDWERMRNDPEFAKIRDEIRTLDQKYPFDFQAAMQRVESLLPPDQAAKGRKQFEERRQSWEARRQERDNEIRDAMQKAIQQYQEAAARGDTDAVRKILDDADSQIERQWMSDDLKRQLRDQVNSARAQAGVNLPKPVEAAEHPWDKLVREFTAQYGLSANQQSAAAAILKDVRNRASQVELTNASKIAAAKEISDSKEREAKMKELNAPIAKLEQELKIRLDGLLTAEQRTKSRKAI